MQLEVNGKRYTVRWTHMHHPTNQIAKATTICAILPPGQFLGPTGMGTAHCSNSDQFVKAIGRKLSLTRALASASFTKAERSAFWSAYLNR